MLTDLSSSLRPAVVLTGLMFVLTGLAYPLAITGVAQALFPHAANGSLIERGGHVIGSSLIGQGFTGAGYLHPRPSAAGKGYDPLASGGSNYGPTSKALVDRIKADVAAQPGAPVDLLTTSASGLDPHISPESALYQARRVANARHMSVADVRQIIAEHTQAPILGMIGEPRVNVLAVNLALDNMAGKGAHTAR